MRIERPIHAPNAERIQADRRARRWVYVVEKRRYLRVLLLPHRETVHNAFFDRRFTP